MTGLEGWRHTTWWSGNEGHGGVGTMVSEELCNDIVEVTIRNDIVKSLVIVIDEPVVREVCPYAPQNEKPMEERGSFYDDLSRV